MTKVIGLYSPVPRSGKGTLADAMQALVPGTKRVCFGEPMYEMAVRIAGSFLDGGEDEAREWLTDGRKDTGVIPRLNVTLRHLLQTLGAWGRSVRSDLWVELVLADVRRRSGPWCPLIIIDNVRYENEFEQLRDRGAALARVVRPNAPETVPHPSNLRLEGYIFDYDVVSDSIEGLHDAAVDILCGEGFLQ